MKEFILSIDVYMYIIIIVCYHNYNEMFNVIYYGFSWKFLLFSIILLQNKNNAFCES